MCCRESVAEYESLSHRRKALHLLKDSHRLRGLHSLRVVECESEFGVRQFLKIKRSKVVN